METCARFLRYCFAIVLSFALSISFAYAQTSSLKLADMFSDHAVLQRDAFVPVWGEAKPLAEVSISLGDETHKTVANAQGQWYVTLAKKQAGGSLNLIVSSGDETIKRENLTFGDVFLCSGQSNMEWRVKYSLNAYNEIAKASSNNIRAINIKKAQAFEALKNFKEPVKWELATEQTFPEWSATCSYFGRELAREIGVTIGLVHASWGGTNIRLWLDQESLTSIGGFEDELEVLRLYNKDQAEAYRLLGKIYEKRAKTKEKPWAYGPKQTKNWPKADVHTNWEKWNDPELKNYNGKVWYSHSFTLTKAQARLNLSLELGKIDELDMTFINGVGVGSNGNPNAARSYAINKDILKPSVNTLMVIVTDSGGDGGFYGQGARQIKFEDGTFIALQDWAYQIARDDASVSVRPPWEQRAGISTITNAMVAPIGPYALKGAVWYQGESNAGEPETYLTFLRALKSQWRKQFNNENLGVAVVQLANFGKPSSQPVESGWAEIREAQRLSVLEDKNSALAVAIDLGEPNDIHPANKIDLGKRLARAVNAKFYGAQNSASGPELLSAEKTEKGILISFHQVDKKLITYSAASPIGFELCLDQLCDYARADIINDFQLLLSLESKKLSLKDVKKIRYCWSDSPYCTLYDSAGLPASPFQSNLP